MAICAYDLCDKTFTPKVSRQKYCCPDHGRKQSTLVQTAKRAEERRRSKDLCTACGHNPKGNGKRFLCDICFRKKHNDIEDEYSFGRI